MNSRTRDGALVSTYDGQGGAIHFLYETAPGRVLLGTLIRPWVSRSAGWMLSRRVSALAVGRFVRKNQLDLTDYPEKKYCSFNDFFTRSILPGRRPVDRNPNHLIAPCDSKLTAIPITGDARFCIKGVDYTMESLVRDLALSERYQGGILLLFRLAVDDYHRYCYVADGRTTDHIRIPGVYHTVSPHATQCRPIYRENTREYSTLFSPVFGRILMMEVGAMMVGKIKNHRGAAQVTRGEEKGLFEFGGSTILLLLEQGRVELDADIVKNSAAGEETIVKMGEKIGTACQ